jgi:hypothetical protein
VANLFSADNAPTVEPHEIVVGDFIQWKRTDLVDDYPPATHSAEYVARITGGGASEIKLAATENDAYYLFTADSVTSAAFTPGYYHWQLEITETSSGNRIVVDRGTFTAIVDLDENNTDPRSHAEIMIAKIESILQGKADSDVASYNIEGRSLVKMTFEQLMQARDKYRQEFTQERNKELALNGEKTSKTIQVRF